jgi:predicted phosphoribosyltransferase
MLFRDRKDAGRRLARVLSEYAGRPDVLVLALPRGGVPVAFEIALALAAPLDVFLVRKLGAPGQEELAMGAIASGGVRVLDRDLVRQLGVSAAELGNVEAAERRELSRRERTYRAGLPELVCRGRTLILVDDGVATGSTLKAAIAALRRLSPKSIVVAVPVGPPSTCRELATLADDVVCLETPEPFCAVGAFYDDFRPTTDAEVRGLLVRAEHEGAAAAGGRAG